MEIDLGWMIFKMSRYYPVSDHLSPGIILTLFLFPGDFEPRDSYKGYSNKKPKREPGSNNRIGNHLKMCHS